MMERNCLLILLACFLLKYLPVPIYVLHVHLTKKAVNNRKISLSTLVNLVADQRSLISLQLRKSDISLIAKGFEWMAKVCWPYFDPEYENLSTRINPPRFSFSPIPPISEISVKWVTMLKKLTGPISIATSSWWNNVKDDYYLLILVVIFQIPVVPTDYVWGIP